MRLSRIKLAGFKSFVDPTTIHLPSDMLAIVGPNGCGKSNIIDAVRWVMGEASAKILRGESMADVIFNGSSARQPVGTATVELLFDNADGAAGGQYANYAEISVKRVVSRDGHSQYFLNGTRCRRRDITDLFLGTGLGPRSYSIIEQGMISQVVEARPEELRAYLEEAAGISKYKERRRETENRIRHTRDNLERLDDIREEVGKQLAHLKRQARAAERYTKLKQEYRRKQAEHLALRWHDLKGQSAQSERTLNKKQNELEAAVAAQRAREAEMEQTREQQHEAGEVFNRAQGELYEVAAEVARLEQAIKHVKELHQRQQQELKEVDASLDELNDHIALDEVQLEQSQSELRTREPEQKQAAHAADAAAMRLEKAEQERSEWRDAWDSHTQAAGSDASSADVARARIDHLDRELNGLVARRRQLETDTEEHDTATLETTKNEINAARESAQKESAALEEDLEYARQELETIRSSLDEPEQTLNDSRRRLQQAQGRLSSLEALQQAALGQEHDDTRAWLEQQGLAEAPRLPATLSVETGWETAVETVLGFSLGAVLCDDKVRHLESLATLEEGNVALADAGDENVDLGPVRGPAVLQEFLSGVHFVADLSEAMSRVPALAAGESVVTRDGEWLGRGWARVHRGQDGQKNILVRDKEINELHILIDNLLDQEELQAAKLTEVRQRVAAQEKNRDILQEQRNEAHRNQAELDAHSKSHETRAVQASKRLAQIATEQKDILRRATECEDELRTARGGLESTLERMAEQESVRQGLNAQRESLDLDYTEARKQTKDNQTKAHELTILVERLQTGLTSTEQALKRMRTQRAQLQTRRDELGGRLEQADTPIGEFQAQLTAQLDKRLEAENQLSAARRRVEGVDQQLREQNDARAGIENNVIALRDAVQEQKLDSQRLSVKQEDVAEQISQAGFDATALVDELPDAADTETWETALEKLATRIQRLEPVNLAAISEYEEQTERKEYLDRQNEDLLEALATLESAIHKIDRQTRTGFKETFDRVNANLKELFPRLFGGGHAYLEMTGDDLLTTGITIMARPPGKRIAHIHLMSGGEKALAAVSFVFAIFQLNPAPFCLLDEVDAPLDDANVGRFSDLVREMSEKVQFVVVTHNKGTMESAFQLIGVTMREAGVSRMVSVDIGEAARMATA